MRMVSGPPYATVWIRWATPIRREVFRLGPLHSALAGADCTRFIEPMRLLTLHEVRELPMAFDRLGPIRCVPFTIREYTLIHEDKTGNWNAQDSKLLLSCRDLALQSVSTLYQQYHGVYVSSGNQG